MTAQRALRSVRLKKKIDRSGQIGEIFFLKAGVRDSSHVPRVPAQGRHALTRLRVPDLDGLVTTGTGYVLPVWAVNHRTDPAIAMR